MAVMSQSQSPLSVPNSVREDGAPVDPTSVAKLQQAAKLANENCDRATILAHTLLTQLREAQSQINQLEAEADGPADRLWAEAETALAKLQADANARVERTKQEADARVARVEAEVESRVRHLQSQLAQAQQLTDQAMADAHIAHDRIARVEAEADERLSRAWAESEDRFIPLKADLAHAELRANRAEQWLALIRREIEDHFMPSLAAMHDQSTVAGSVTRPVPPTTLVASDTASEK
jgi:chromosome segregation ATPase